MSSIKLKGDTSGEITIQAPSVAGTNTINLQASSGTLATTAQASIGTKNLIINGNMRIAQRGTSATVSGATFAYRTVDRFLFRANGVGAFTESQDTDVPSGQGFSKSVKYLCTTSASPSTSGWLQFNYRMEGQNLQHLNYGTSETKKLTASFWVKSNKTGIYITRLFSNDTTRSIQKAITINSANTWEKKIITFDGDTVSSLDDDNNFSLSFDMWLSAGTNYQSGTLATTWSSYLNANSAVGQVNLADSVNNYINITGVQLEAGTEATPFEVRPYDMELLRCMRYFINYGTNNIHGCVYAGSQSLADIFFRVEMRSAPSATYTAGIAGTSFQVQNYRKGYVYRASTADTYLTSLTLSAEL